MNHSELIDKLLRELSYRVGIVNLKNKNQQSIISEILSEWGEYEAKKIIMEFLTEAGKTPDTNKPKDDTKGPDKEYVHIGKAIYVKKSDVDSKGRAKEGAQKYKKDASGALTAISDDVYSKEKSTQGAAGEKAASTTTQNKQGGGDIQQTEEPVKGTSLKQAGYDKKVENEDETRKQIEAETSVGVSITQTNEDIKEELDKTQSDLEQKRDMGIAGAGGAAASQGESRYCNTMNTLNNDEFKQKHKKQIDEEVNRLKSRTGRSKFPNTSEGDTLLALGLDPLSPEAYEYIATREVFAQQELQRIKNIDNSVFYLKGKKGFDGKDDAYLEWMRAGYDGALATRKILDEDTDMDMSKPNKTIQSETDIDDTIELKISKKLEQAKKDNNQENINYYINELKSFKKFRKYHDTYTVGQDSNGRMCVVSISNKKGDNLKDPQNNTTPANRFNVIKEQYGESVAKTVGDSLDEGIETVSDTKKAAIRSTNTIDIDESIVAVCELPDMKKYIDKLDNNAAFIKYAEGKGRLISSLSTAEKLKLMQEHSASILSTGKSPAFEPYGKIMTKIGELSQTNKFRDANSSINFDSSSISRCITMKQTEKDAVTTSHNKVVEDIKSADEKLGFPKDGKNGPHVQGYIGTVLDAMHFDSYIDGGDGKMIIQMGIRGAQPKDIRGCLAEKSGFAGDTSTTEGREMLKKHLRERCRVDSKSGAIIVTDSNGTSEICEDTWRTAGTSQKVASGFGKDMRNCISSKVDARRSSN